MDEYENKQEEEKEPYEMEIECENCRETETYDIPFGITVNEFLRKKDCENCGCGLKQE